MSPLFFLHRVFCRSTWQFSVEGARHLPPSLPSSPSHYVAITSASVSPLFRATVPCEAADGKERYTRLVTRYTPALFCHLYAPVSFLITRSLLFIVSLSCFLHISSTLIRWCSEIIWKCSCYFVLIALDLHHIYYFLALLLFPNCSTEHSFLPFRRNLIAGRFNFFYPLHFINCGWFYFILTRVTLNSLLPTAFTDSLGSIICMI